MDKKTTGIVATVVTVLLCGCPGLLGLCVGLMFAVVSQIPGANIDVFGSSDPGSAIRMGLITSCVSILFIIVPIVVGIVTLRNKKNGTNYAATDETIPPAN